MRKVCRLAREVLDVVAAEVRPGVTTDYLDEVCHKACIERKGYHADVNETYYVGDRAKADPDSVRVVETTRECLDAAIKIVKPGTPIREFGKIIEKHAKSRNCSVVKTWGGHGINTNFHPPPWIPHYAKNKAVGVCKPGMTFTIEPILTVGEPREVFWPDDWTNATVDGKRTAQFETGVEILTAGNENSPGGPIPTPTNTSGTTAANGASSS
ncbi:hypothetical protein DH86_00001414 [Scytalidium sp. 3C]|nr:hypothetical protein DH86_00001414 [Scytalidium sp. 3C]